MPVVKNIDCFGRCLPRIRADNRGVAEGEDGNFNGVADYSVGLHLKSLSKAKKVGFHEKSHLYRDDRC